MTVIFDRPYEFIPPNRNDLWPTWIQRLRIVDRYLKKKEGVVSFECRNLDAFCRSVSDGHGVLLAPNHCRYADPLVLGWPARLAKTHVFAMASWHLFNKSVFDTFAIRRMGGFSVFREGTDRQALETAIEILASAERPLILFPEGTTNRTNDVLKPLLDGVTFIARAAARRRAKQKSGKVVIHPVGMKYLCKDDFRPWAEKQLSHIEAHLGWHDFSDHSILERTTRLAEALLGLREVEYFGYTHSGKLPARRDALIEHILSASESRLHLESENKDVRTRVRAIRTEVTTQWFASDHAEAEQIRLKSDAQAADLSQELLSYPDCYLVPGEATDTRIIETIQRMQESLFGKADIGIPLHVVIQFAESFSVPAEKAQRGAEDPLLGMIRAELQKMLHELSREATKLG